MPLTIDEKETNDPSDQTTTSNTVASDLQHKVFGFLCFAKLLSNAGLVDEKSCGCIEKAIQDIHDMEWDNNIGTDNVLQNMVVTEEWACNVMRMAPAFFSEAMLQSVNGITEIVEGGELFEKNNNTVLCSNEPLEFNARTEQEKDAGKLNGTRFSISLPLYIQALLCDMAVLSKPRTHKGKFFCNAVQPKVNQRTQSVQALREWEQCYRNSEDSGVRVMGGIVAAMTYSRTTKKFVATTGRDSIQRRSVPIRNSAMVGTHQDAFCCAVCPDLDSVKKFYFAMVS